MRSINKQTVSSIKRVTVIAEYDNGDTFPVQLVSSSGTMPIRIDVSMHRDEFFQGVTDFSDWVSYIFDNETEIKITGGKMIRFTAKKEQEIRYAISE